MLLVIFFLPIEAMSQVQIGSGTSNNYGSPLYGLYDFSQYGVMAALRSASSEGLVRMTLSNEMTSDETIVLFNQDAEDTFDAYDSHKFWASLSIPQVYTTTGADTLVINGLSSTVNNPIVDLGVKLPVAGNYSFNATSITLTEETVHLEDRLLGTFQDLNANPQYDFTSNESGNIPSRFALHFNSANNNVITSNSNVSHHGMTINFLPTTGGEKRIIRYHEFGNSPNFSWKVLPPDRVSGYANGLESDTRYTFRVGTRCPGENAVYGDTASFWTRLAPCAAPVAAAAVNGITATINWASTAANYYKLRYRLVGGSWSYRNTGQNSVSINGLAAGDYEWQIRAICLNGGNKPYSAIETFTVGQQRLAADNANDELVFNLYPNPTNGLVTIEFASEENESVMLNVSDLTGKTVYSRSFALQKGLNKLSLNLTDLETGVYLTTLSNQAGISERVSIVLN